MRLISFLGIDNYAEVAYLADLAEYIYNWHGWETRQKVEGKKSVLADLRA